MGVLNTDLAKQLGTTAFGARLWRLTPGQASTKHRHQHQTELYVLLEGTGRIRVEDELLTLRATVGGHRRSHDRPSNLQRHRHRRAVARLRDTGRGGQHARDDTRDAGRALPRRAQGATTRTRPIDPRENRSLGPARQPPARRLSEQDRSVGRFAEPQPRVWRHRLPSSCTSEELVCRCSPMPMRPARRSPPSRVAGNAGANNAADQIAVAQRKPASDLGEAYGLTVRGFTRS